MTVGSLLPPPIRTIASNLARRRRKNHGFEPHIGKLFPPPFPSFFLPRFFGFFPPSLLPAAFLCQRLPSLFLPLTALFSPIFPPATHVLHASSFRCFVSAHQSSVFIPRSGTPASASGANVVSPCSSPHLAPFAPSRLPCCLGPSPALLSASLLNSLSPSLFLSLSPVLFSPRPPLLLSVLSSSPPLRWQLLSFTGQLYLFLFSSNSTSSSLLLRRFGMCICACAFPDMGRWGYNVQLRPSWFEPHIGLQGPRPGHRLSFSLLLLYFFSPSSFSPSPSPLLLLSFAFSLLLLSSLTLPGKEKEEEKKAPRRGGVWGGAPVFKWFPQKARRKKKKDETKGKVR